MNELQIHVSRALLNSTDFTYENKAFKDFIGHLQKTHFSWFHSLTVPSLNKDIVWPSCFSVVAQTSLGTISFLISTKWHYLSLRCGPEGTTKVTGNWSTSARQKGSRELELFRLEKKLKWGISDKGLEWQSKGEWLHSDRQQGQIRY